MEVEVRASGAQKVADRAFALKEIVRGAQWSTRPGRAVNQVGWVLSVEEARRDRATDLTPGHYCGQLRRAPPRVKLDATVASDEMLDKVLVLADREVARESERYAAHVPLLHGTIE